MSGDYDDSGESGESGESGGSGRLIDGYVVDDGSVDSGCHEHSENLYD